MLAHDLSSGILGVWESPLHNTELGPVRQVFHFSADHHYRLETYFLSTAKPIITQGTYDIVRNQLVVQALNKGQPIRWTLRTHPEQLILYLPGEAPVVLKRQHS